MAVLPKPSANPSLKFSDIVTPESVDAVLRALDTMPADAMQLDTRRGKVRDLLNEAKYELQEAKDEHDFFEASLSLELSAAVREDGSKVVDGSNQTMRDRQLAVEIAKSEEWREAVAFMRDREATVDALTVELEVIEAGIRANYYQWRGLLASAQLQSAAIRLLPVVSEDLAEDENANDEVPPF